MNITRQQWSAEADGGLVNALPSARIRAIVADEVRAGVSKLWRCTSDKHAAWIVTRIDHNPDELVIVAFEGSGMQAFAPAFIAAAKERGLPMRAHVTNEIVERLLRRMNFKRCETILRAA